MKSAEPEDRRAALLRWARFAVVLQALVILGATGWVAGFLLAHVGGYVWVAPPVGLLVGTALPLQVVAAAVMRAGRG